MLMICQVSDLNIIYLHMHVYREGTHGRYLQDTVPVALLFLYLNIFLVGKNCK